VHEANEAAPASGDLSSTAKGNLELLAGFYEREDAKISGIQLLIERVSSFFGSPAYFAFVVVFIVVWTLVNLWGSAAGWKHFDEPPFFISNRRFMAQNGIRSWCGQ
jgi:uncharacterized membrane protein